MEIIDYEAFYTENLKTEGKTNGNSTNTTTPEQRALQSARDKLKHFENLYLMKGGKGLRQTPYARPQPPQQYHPPPQQYYPPQPPQPKGKGAALPWTQKFCKYCANYYGKTWETINRWSSHDSQYCRLAAKNDCRLLQIFKSVSGCDSVRIRGVAGVDTAYIGKLRDCILGVGVKAIFYPNLPPGLEGLISVCQLNQSGWEVRFGPPSIGHSMRRLIDGTVVTLGSTEKGLPSIDSIMTLCETKPVYDGFCFSPCTDTSPSPNGEFMQLPVLVRKIR